MTPSLTSTNEPQQNQSQENAAIQLELSEIGQNESCLAGAVTAPTNVQNPVQNLQDLNANDPSPLAKHSHTRNFLNLHSHLTLSVPTRIRSDSDRPLDPSDTEWEFEETQDPLPHGEWISKQPYKPEKLKTLVAFVAVVFCAFVNFAILTLIHDISPRTPLPDLTFIFVPQQGWALHVGDALSAVSVIVAFCCMLLHKYRWILFRRAFLIAAVLYLLRAVCLGVTFMPPSFRNPAAFCIPSLNGTAEVETILERLVDYVATLGLTSGEEKILCGDLMFSGHTVMLTLMYFLVLQYTPHKAWPIRWVMTPVCYFGLITVVISGGHYTIDVLVAYWLTSHLFWSYHQVYEMPKRLTHRRKHWTRKTYIASYLDQPVVKRRRNAPVTRLWWYWATEWFECNVPDGCLPNKLSWPLPWPELCIKVIEMFNKKLNE